MRGVRIAAVAVLAIVATLALAFAGLQTALALPFAWVVYFHCRKISGLDLGK